jgi:hypothetical protein
MNDLLIRNVVAKFLGRPGRYVPATPDEFADQFPTVSPVNCTVSGSPAAPPKVNTTNVAALGSGGLGVVKAGTQPTHSPELSRVEKLIMALVSAEGPVCISELARRMGCSAAEASRRIKLAGPKVRRKKKGKFVYISLR